MSENLSIHTHDRITFKRCRRKWAWSSPLRDNLESKSTENKINLWFGSGFHFALEDYHGYRIFDSPEEALGVYYGVFNEKEIPSGGAALIETGMGMLSYYTKWLEDRGDYTTLWLDDKPQVEIAFTLELEELHSCRGIPVYYHGTIDRIVVDKAGDLWIEDYKTAAVIDVDKLTTDPQIGAYLWAIEQYLQKPVRGMLYTQFAKSFPSEPKRLVNGDFSVDKRQKVTYKILLDALLDTYGMVPTKYSAFLQDLADDSTPEGDRFIRRDQVIRTEREKTTTYRDIIEEGRDMLSDRIALYPNPTRDCKWDCPFRVCCICKNDMQDYQHILDLEFAERNQTAKGEIPEWRTKLNRAILMRMTSKPNLSPLHQQYKEQLEAQLTLK